MGTSQYKYSTDMKAGRDVPDRDEGQGDMRGARGGGGHSVRSKFAAKGAMEHGLKEGVKAIVRAKRRPAEMRGIWSTSQPSL